MDLKFSVIETITNNFSEDQKVGSGGYGDVYKAVYNGKEIAVKKLHPLQGIDDQQFHSELLNLTKVSHQNVVQLIGYCYETRSKYLKHNGETIWATSMERVLCSEYMQGGNLERHIGDESCKLDWPTCYKIIRGTCEGLHHLHSAPEYPIFHLDLKPANIFLDMSMTPKIADPGLNRSGTLGYMPPEFLRGEITPMWDIFSLGVIILEVITGHRKYLNDIRKSSKDFIEDELQKWRNRLQKEPGYTSLEADCQQIERCIQIGLICVNPERTKRPTMKKIIDMLEGIEHMDWYISNELSEP